MFAVGVLCTWSVDYAVVWSENAEEKSGEKCEAQ